MKNLIKLVLLVLSSLFVTLILWFVATVIFTANWPFRFFFWLTFCLLMSLEILLSVFVFPWTKEYINQLRHGKTKKAAFDLACKIRLRPPKFILSFITRFI